MSQAPRTQKLQLLAALALTMGAPASAWRDEGMPRRAMGLGSARGRVEKLKWVALLEQGCQAVQQRKARRTTGRHAASVYNRLVSAAAARCEHGVNDP